MELRPEQLRALDYLRRKGTEASPARLREQVAVAFAELEALLAETPAPLRAVRPSPTRWSVQEVLDHLVLSHRPAVEQLRSLVAGARPASPAIPPSLHSEHAAERPHRRQRGRRSRSGLSRPHRGGVPHPQHHAGPRHGDG